MPKIEFCESNANEILDSLRRTADGVDKKNPDLIELICKKSGICDNDLVELQTFLRTYHTSISLSKLELPKNQLTSASGPSLANILLLQKDKLLRLNLFCNPLGSEGLSKLLKLLVSQCVTATNLTHLDLAKTQLGSKGGLVISQLLRIFRSIQELNLSHNALGTKGIKSFCEELAIHPTLKILNLSDNNIKHKGISTLAKAIIKCNYSTSTLRSLDLSANAMGHQGMKTLSELLTVNPPIESLYIGSNNIGDKGAVDLAEVIRLNHTLKVLHTENNNIGPEGAKDLFRELQGDSLYSAQTLEELNLAKNNIRIEGATYLSKVLQSNHALTNINLSENGIGSDGIFSLTDALFHNNSLVHLNVSTNNLDDSGVREIVRVLTDPKYHPIRTIKLEDNPTDISEEVLTSLSRVEQIKRNRKHWLDNQILRVIQCKISAIDWTSKNVGNDELLLLNGALNDPELQQQQTQIQQIRLTGSLLTSLSLVPFLGVCIPSPSRVARLYLKDCSNAGEEIAFAISEHLPNSTDLEVLSLTGCCITKKGASNIAKGLSTNTTLRRLILDNNQIGDYGLESIASTLPHITLECLSANNNEITDLGMGSPRLSRVSKLHLTTNRITDRGALELAKDLVVCNHWLNYLNLKKNQVTEKGAKAIRLFMPDSIPGMCTVDH